MIKAIKIRLYPSENQENYISQLLGSCRFAYNACLAFKIKRYQEESKSTSLGECGKFLTHLKNQEETKWLKDVHSKVLQQTLINLEVAYKSFFRNGAGFPKFKSKRDSKQSCRFPVDAISSIRGNRINIIKPLKDIHFKCSIRDEKLLNKFQDKILSGTLTKTKSGKYEFSVLIDLPESEKLPKNENKVGLDIGIKSFIIDSNGKEYENLKLIRSHSKKLAKLQRNLSKKVKDSKNFHKARIKLARFHEKLTNIKNFYLHSVVNSILKENQLVVIEDLNVKGMMRNHNLARSIQELSIYQFKQILSYKANWLGRDLIQIDRFFPSSKLCGKCGVKNENLELKDREWGCISCGAKHSRDLNAAQNILKEGIRLSGLSSPFEPVESDDCVGPRSRKKHLEYFSISK
jgi:putative transposase